MNLSKENIQFIDNYLKNSEVVYFDIRMEMLDHLASAVEQKMKVEKLNFYDAFKQYMIENKKELLKTNKEEGLHFKEPLKKFGHFIIQPFQLVLALCAFLGISFLSKQIGLQVVFNNYYYPFFIVTYLGFGFYHFLKHRKRKFYYIDKNFSILYILYHFGLFFNRTANESINTSIIFNSIILFVFLAFVRFYYLEMKSFKKRNQFLCN